MICSKKSIKSRLSWFQHGMFGRVGTLGLMLISLLTAGGHALAASTSSTYTREAFLPYLSAAYYVAASGPSTYLSSDFLNPSTLMIGTNLPPELLQDMIPGEVDRIKVLVPPGAQYANFQVQTGVANGVKWGVFSQNLPFCNGQASNNLQTCISSQDLGGSAQVAGTLYQTSGATATNPTARYIYLIIQAGAAGFRFGNIQISMNINDPAAYTTWRSARSWAGGSGDCDGLGTTNCTSAPPPASTPTITASLTSPTVGSAITINISGGKAGQAITWQGVSGAILSALNGLSAPVLDSNGSYTTPPINVGSTAGAQTISASLNGTSVGSVAITVLASTPTTGQSCVVGVVSNGQAPLTCTITSTITVPPGATPPAPPSLSVGGSTTATGVGLTIMVKGGANHNYNGYYVVSALPPTGALKTPEPDKIVAGLEADGITKALLSNPITLQESVPADIPLTGLMPGVSYQAFVYAVDATNSSSVTPVVGTKFTTAGSPEHIVFTDKLAATLSTSSLKVNIQPATYHKGKPGKYYIAAQLPSSGTFYFMTKAGGWTGPWGGGVLTPYDITNGNGLGDLPVDLLVGIVDEAIIKNLAGFVFYAGYGMDGADNVLVSVAHTIAATSPATP